MRSEIAECVQKAVSDPSEFDHDTTGCPFKQLCGLFDLVGWRLTAGVSRSAHMNNQFCPIFALFEVHEAPKIGSSAIAI